MEFLSAHIPGALGFVSLGLLAIWKSPRFGERVIDFLRVLEEFRDERRRRGR
jgi:hypothetical protein